MGLRDELDAAHRDHAERAAGDRERARAAAEANAVAARARAEANLDVAFADLVATIKAKARAGVGFHRYHWYTEGDPAYCDALTELLHRRLRAEGLQVGKFERDARIVGTDTEGYGGHWVFRGGFRVIW